MKIVELEQRTEEWHNFRRQHLCASEIASILGICPFGGTKLKVFEEKVLGKRNEFFSPIMQRGVDLEPAARAWVEQETGLSLAPICVESENHPWAAASLDGYDLSDDIVVEIKCGSAKLHEKAQNGEIPDNYRAQINWQLFVTGAKKALFCSFAGLGGVLIEIERDELEIQRLVRAGESFWKNHIEAMVSPEPSDKDWDEEKSADWIDIASEYRSLLEQQQQLEYELKVRKTRLEELAKGRVRIKGGGIKYYQTIRKGNVDFDAFFRHMGVDVSQLSTYRKTPIVTTNIRMT